jgi:hypothetical protein
MSRRLGSLALALGLLVCSMGLKNVLSSNHSYGSVTLLNGPDPIPPPHFKLQKNGPDPIPPPGHVVGPVLEANGPDPMPKPPKPGPKSSS